MLLFNKKLLAAKRLREEDDGADSDMGSSMAEGQKQAISTLSKHEKLLLLELQKTRLSIVDELQQLDPSISAGTYIFLPVNPSAVCLLCSSLCLCACRVPPRHPYTCLLLLLLLHAQHVN